MAFSYWFAHPRVSFLPDGARLAVIGRFARLDGIRLLALGKRPPFPLAALLSDGLGPQAAASPRGRGPCPRADVGRGSAAAASGAPADRSPVSAGSG
ncbi:MAG: hypothetical protein OZSIB_1881 [Candidatus Ozemobacter sibiricus]|uniref:Uncharacterized protein n=1 Tax=Candidatus Ozemobacter sibiricus TaxID=2268124 RepID=A0A367ZKQ2_9BACT|nr:MAG: hypothetical protein OZSIB_1881 [Candidatus Ozemobacter sibiricus]